MKTKTLCLLLGIMIILPATSNGQIGNLLKNKLNKVVNAGAKTAGTEVSNKVDTTVQKSASNAGDKAATKIESSTQGDTTKSTGQGNKSSGGLNFGKLMGGKVDLKYNDDYNFTSRIYMVTESYEKKDVTKMDFYMYYSANSPTVGMETKTVTNDQGQAAPIASSMVMDGENKCFLILTNVNGTKMGIISAISDSAQTQPNGKTTKKTTPPTFTKTGNTRVIAGYKCDEYSYTDTENKKSGKVWFTKDANLKIDKRSWKNTGMATFYGSTQFNDGIILASEAYDEKGKLTTKAETVEIDPSFPYSISVKGYTLRQMNMGQGQKK